QHRSQSAAQVLLEEGGRQGGRYHPGQHDAEHQPIAGVVHQSPEGGVVDAPSNCPKRPYLAAAACLVRNAVVMPMGVPVSGAAAMVLAWGRVGGGGARLLC